MTPEQKAAFMKNNPELVNQIREISKKEPELAQRLANLAFENLPLATQKVAMASENPSLVKKLEQLEALNPAYKAQNEALARITPKTEFSDKAKDNKRLAFGVYLTLDSNYTSPTGQVVNIKHTSFPNESFGYRYAGAVQESQEIRIEKNGDLSHARNVPIAMPNGSTGYLFYNSIITDRLGVSEQTTQENTGYIVTRDPRTKQITNQLEFKLSNGHPTEIDGVSIKSDSKLKALAEHFEKSVKQIEEQCGCEKEILEFRLKQFHSPSGKLASLDAKLENLPAPAVQPASAPQPVSAPQSSIPKQPSFIIPASQSSATLAAGSNLQQQTEALSSLRASPPEFSPTASMVKELINGNTISKGQNVSMNTSYSNSTGGVETRTLHSVTASGQFFYRAMPADKSQFHEVKLGDNNQLLFAKNVPLGNNQYFYYNSIITDKIGGGTPDQKPDTAYIIEKGPTGEITKQTEFSLSNGKVTKINGVDITPSNQSQAKALLNTFDSAVKSCTDHCECELKKFDQQLQGHNKGKTVGLDIKLPENLSLPTQQQELAGLSPSNLTGGANKKILG